MISDHEFKWLSIKVFEEEGMMRTVEYIKRLFLLFIEIEYFEKKLKRTIKMNSGFITLIKERMINP